MTTRISVAMATYNGEKYIKEQLYSIAKQTLPPYELVVCDDGSSDETVSLVRDFSLTVSFPVKIIINEINLGFSNNFLKCASYCIGNWIAFCDQDDIWLPDKLAVIKGVIDASPTNLFLVYHAAELVNEDLEPLGRKLPVINKDRISPIATHSGFWFVGGCVICFKSKLILDVDSNLRPRDNYQYNEGWNSGKYPWMPHDKWICMLANISGEIASISRVLSLYRRHDFALTGSHISHSVAMRVGRSLFIDNKAYDFLSKASFETANSLLNISAGVSSNFQKKNLIDGAERYKKMSLIFDLRAKLYNSKSFCHRISFFSNLILNRAYLNNKFCSLGIQSLLKDLLFVSGIIIFFKFFFSRGLS